MGEGSFNIELLTRRLGLKNIRELPLVRALTPVILAGDARDLVPSLEPATAWAGSSIAQVALERCAFQLRSLAAGGTVVTRLVWAGVSFGASPLFTRWRIDLDGADPLAADPLAGAAPEIFNTGPTPVASVLTVGTSTVALGTNIVHDSLGGPTRLLLEDIFLPHGSLMTLTFQSINVGAVLSIHWREIAAADLTPTG